MDHWPWKSPINDEGSQVWPLLPDWVTRCGKAKQPRVCSEGSSGWGLLLSSQRGNSGAQKLSAQLPCQAGAQCKRGHGQALPPSTKQGTELLTAFHGWAWAFLLQKSGICSQMVLGSCHRMPERGQDCAGLDLWGERWAQGTEKQWGLGWWWRTEAWSCDQDIWRCDQDI